MQMIDGIPVWGVPQDNAVEQMRTCKRTAARVALMADHHLGYAVPIGGVVAYHGRISPSGVGYDIACGNKAVLTDAPVAEVRKNIAKIMDDIWHSLSFGIGRKNKEEVEHPLFNSPAWDVGAVSTLKVLAREQLGTIGSGNHFVDLFEDEAGRVWIGVHFGSRGLGHKIATYFIKAGGGKDGVNVEPVTFDAESALGKDYLVCMSLAGRYAYAGRDWVCGKVAALLGANIIDEVHNHHNFSWLETHDGAPLWVVRKGATPAFPGQRSFIGGSMGDGSVIVEGVDSDESKVALYSTVHGAGRVMGRNEAAGKRKKWGQPRVGGKISKEMMTEWVKRENVELRGAGTDESPHCYKRLSEVLAHHEASIRILHKLSPIGVAMAGEDEEDPYKD